MFLGVASPATIAGLLLPRAPLSGRAGPQVGPERAGQSVCSPSVKVWLGLVVMDIVVLPRGCAIHALNRG